MRRALCSLSTLGRRFSSTEIQKPSLTIIRHPFALDGSALEPPEEPVNRFAVVEFMASQYKVTTDDSLTVDHFDVDIGESVELDKVLMVGSKYETHLGRPYVGGAKVMAVVEELVKDEKVVAFKKRRRKNRSATIKGHRRKLVVLRIGEIIYE